MVKTAKSMQTAKRQDFSVSLCDRQTGCLACLSIPRVYVNSQTRTAHCIN